MTSYFIRCLLAFLALNTRTVLKNFIISSRLCGSECAGAHLLRRRDAHSYSWASHDALLTIVSLAASPWQRVPQPRCEVSAVRHDAFPPPRRQLGSVLKVEACAAFVSTSINYHSAHVCSHFRSNSTASNRLLLWVRRQRSLMIKHRLFLSPAKLTPTFSV